MLPPLEEFNCKINAEPRHPEPHDAAPGRAQAAQPARFDRCMLPELTPDGRCVYSTEALARWSTCWSRSAGTRRSRRARAALGRHAGHEPRDPGLSRQRRVGVWWWWWWWCLWGGTRPHRASPGPAPTHHASPPSTKSPLQYLIGDRLCTTPQQDSHTSPGSYPGW